MRKKKLKLLASYIYYQNSKNINNQTRDKIINYVIVPKETKQNSYEVLKRPHIIIGFKFKIELNFLLTF